MILQFHIQMLLKFIPTLIDKYKLKALKIILLYQSCLARSIILYQTNTTQVYIYGANTIYNNIIMIIQGKSHQNSTILQL